MTITWIDGYRCANCSRWTRTARVEDRRLCGECYAEVLQNVLDTQAKNRESEQLDLLATAKEK